MSQNCSLCICIRIHCIWKGYNVIVVVPSFWCVVCVWSPITKQIAACKSVSGIVLLTIWWVLIVSLDCVLSTSVNCLLLYLLAWWIALVVRRWVSMSINTATVWSYYFWQNVSECVCVCARARACVRAWVRACVRACVRDTHSVCNMQRNYLGHFVWK